MQQILIGHYGKGLRDKKQTLEFWLITPWTDLAQNVENYPIDTLKTAGLEYEEADLTNIKEWNSLA